MTALDGWHDYLKTYDHAALRALLRPSVFTTSCSDVFEVAVADTVTKAARLTLRF